MEKTKYKVKLANLEKLKKYLLKLENNSKPNKSE